jgi:NAD(P)-dependent dehydrogenase (short-subunit alcohol dehydrogenase family)
VTTSFLPLLREGKDKKVIFISSGVASLTRTVKKSFGPMAPYAMSKVSAATTGNDAMISITATLLMGTKCTRAMTQTGLNMVVALYSVELSDEGFTCLAFDPGHVQTDMGGGHVSPRAPTILSYYAILPLFTKHMMS